MATSCKSPSHSPRQTILEACIGLFAPVEFVANENRGFSLDPSHGPVRNYLRPAAVVFVMVPLASSSLRAQMNAPPRPPGTRVRTYAVLSHTVTGSS